MRRGVLDLFARLGRVDLGHGAAAQQERGGLLGDLKHGKAFQRPQSARAFDKLVFFRAWLAKFNVPLMGHSFSLHAWFLFRMAEYKVKLTVFEGPLDLLLHLIRQSELEISEISISQITTRSMSG